MNEANPSQQIAKLSARVNALQEIIVDMLKMVVEHDPDLLSEIEVRLETAANDFSDGGFDEEAATIESVLGDFIGRPS